MLPVVRFATAATTTLLCLSVISAVPAASAAPAPTCSPTAGKAIGAALNTSRTMLAHTGLKTTTDHTTIPGAKTNPRYYAHEETLTTADGTAGSSLIQNPNRASLFIVVTKTASGKFTLHHKIGAGYEFRGGITHLGGPRNISTVANSAIQAARLRTELNAPNLGWLEQTDTIGQPSDLTPVSDFNDTIDRELSFPLNRLCAVVSKQPDGSVLYHHMVGTNTNSRDSIVVAKNGTVARLSIFNGATTMSTVKFFYQNVTVATVDKATVHVYDKTFDTAVNKVFISDVGNQLADNIASEANVVAKDTASKKVTVPLLRREASKLHKLAGGLYVLDGVSWRPTPTQFGWFFTKNNFTHPYSIAGITNGVRVRVVTGSSSAVYHITVVAGLAKVHKSFSN